MTTKEKIIQLLSENKDEFVSGEDLALKLSLSRAAVWKAIKALESDGYKIEAVTNRGYRICALPDKLDLRTLAAVSGLEPGQVMLFDSIDSTNKEAKRRIVEGAKLHKTLFAAEEQTAGRGRLERKFLSPAKKGVYFTLVYCPKTQVNPAVMTSAAAVSVCQAVEELYKTGCSVKWVNDIFSGGKKIAGILTEGITNFESGTIDAIIVGIGINVLKNEFDGPLSKVAGSIEDACSANRIECNPAQNNKSELIGKVVNKLIQFYDSFYDSTDAKKSEDAVKRMLDEYRRRSFLIDKKVNVNPVAGTEGKMYRALVRAIDNQAGLVVELEDGSRKTLYSGEVSLKSDEFVC